MQATWVACLFEYFTRGGGGEIFAFVLAALGEKPRIEWCVVSEQHALRYARGVELEGYRASREDKFT